MSPPFIPPTRRLGLLLVVSLSLAGSSWGGEIAPVNSAASATTAGSDARLPPQELARRIDTWIAAQWEAAGIEPAPACDDAEFLRRVSLDLTGKIPSLPDARRFLLDPDPNKRPALVERSLSHASYAAHFANVWRSLLLPGASANEETRALVPPLEAWLRLRFAEKASYDRLVTEILTTRVDAAPAGGGVSASTTPTPAAFFFANQRKAESLAASVSRIFLGVQLQCAECHDHPFADWKRDEFWSFAAFFRDVAAPQVAAEGSMTIGPPPNSDAGIEIPGTGRRVAAGYLRDATRTPDTADNPRVQLAAWITAADNPYFARATVNRVWAHFLGYGLVEPVDDVSAANAPSHPEVLDELVSQFIAQGYDLEYLVRTIVSTRAYQLASGGTTATDLDPRLFARMPLKTLSAEQLFDSLVEATGYRPPRPTAGAAPAGNEGSARAQFIARFGIAGQQHAEGETSILLALALMNGEMVGGATDLEESETLAAIVAAPFFDTAGRVEALYLATLARTPTLAERLRLVAYVEAGDDESARARWADIFWALLNSSEFQLNH